jgi:YegS/Rv2252/BmrU family lipid kinase
VSICVIFNPSARGEKAKRFRAYLEESCSDWTLKPTTGPGAARTLAAEAVRQGFKTIVAAGGDGTLNEVINGIADTPQGLEASRLGVLPLGTINVFARELRLPLDISKICSLLCDSSGTAEIRIDLGCAEYQSKQGVERRYFAQLAGAGFDARSVELVSWELKKKVGPAAYVVAGLQALGGVQPEITICGGGKEVTGELILIGNGKFYGGNFPVFHKSDLQDGVLDAVVFPKVNWQSLPGHLLDFVRGKLFKEGGSIYLQASRFELSADQHAALQLEGELVGQLPATISIAPRALRVVAPQNFQAIREEKVPED